MDETVYAKQFFKRKRQGKLLTSHISRIDEESKQAYCSHICIWLNFLYPTLSIQIQN